ncbi:hypothetical protein ON010_g4116 [Phytophthora cinnamomi]|nr:hypothetical protein ON010_g4116 [Phytophthora cinnamomi]
MGSDAKAKTNKRLHEDEGDADERDGGANVQPLDMLSMQQLLESMGADKFEPRVVAQLQEFVHRDDGAGGQAQQHPAAADLERVRCAPSAAAAPADHQGERPAGPGASLLEVGIDWKEISRLTFYLLGVHIAAALQRTPNTPRLVDAAGFGAGLRADAARPPMHPRIEGSRNKKFSRSPIPINLNSNM